MLRKLKELLIISRLSKIAGKQYGTIPMKDIGNYTEKSHIESGNKVNYKS